MNLGVGGPIESGGGGGLKKFLKSGGGGGGVRGVSSPPRGLFNGTALSLFVNFRHIIGINKHYF